ncbi:MAG: cell wall-active antibiotics response protein LiaF [Candidatus Zixiibacteriota bacterium]
MKPRTKVIFGIAFVFFGFLLLGESTGLFDPGEAMGLLFPFMMIGVGFWLIARRKRQSAPSSTASFYCPPTPPRDAEPDVDKMYQQQEQTQSTGKSASSPEDTSYRSSNYEQATTSESPSTDDSGKLKYSKSLGDMLIDFRGVNIHNVEISAGVGDLEIRLSGGVLSDGLNRIIISSFIGDIRIYAPADLPVFTHCSNFVGDIELMGKRASGFGNSIDSQTANYGSSPKKLYMACNSFIGDIRYFTI